MTRDEAEIEKLQAETQKIRAETQYYPVIAAASFFAAVIALSKLLLN